MNTVHHDDVDVEVHEEFVQQDGPVPVDRHERVEVVRDHGLEHRERVVEDRGAARVAARFKLTNLVWLLVGVLELLLLLRLGLKMIAANPDAPFAAMVYGVTDLFLWPFFGVIGNPATSAGMVFEVTTLLAMVVYLALAWIVVKVIQLVTAPGPTTARSVHVERHEQL
jgi:hypothetical protein